VVFIIVGRSPEFAKKLRHLLARIAHVTEGGLSKRDIDALIRRLKRNRID